MKPGIYPAAVTPFLDNGEIDHAGVARLLAWFESKGCRGVVLAGTNGEGPSLAAVEKRDLLHEAVRSNGKLDLVLGVATASLAEAIWSCKQAERNGAEAVLLMPPSYYREADEHAIEAWFRAVMDAAELPVLFYNFPFRSGVPISPALAERLSDHSRFAGLKDSSGVVENIPSFPRAVPGKCLYVGSERHLLMALQSGWCGSISGAANCFPRWLSMIADLFADGKLEQAHAKAEMLIPALELLARPPQPAAHKAILHRLGVLRSPSMRLPLTTQTVSEQDWALLQPFATA